MSFSRLFGIDVDSKGGVLGLTQFAAAATAADTATGGVVGRTGLLKGMMGPLAGAIAIATAGVVLGTKAFVEYETALAEVNTLLSESQSIAEYSDEIRRLAVEFGSPAFEQAGAAYQIISAGARDAAEATSILTAANKLAVGGVTDINTAADGLTTILNAYNLEASSAGAVSDILFSTMKSGKTTIGELSSSLGQIVPTAAQLGVSLPEVTAAVGALTTNGVATTEAVTQINAALTAMLKVTPDAALAAKEMGLEFSASRLESVGFAQVMDEVAVAVDGDAEALARLFPRSEALRAVLALTGGTASKFTEILEANQNAAGQTEAAYEKMSATTAQNFGRLTAKFDEFALTIGEDVNPLVNDLIDLGETLVDTLSTIYDGWEQLFELLGQGSPLDDVNQDLEDIIGIMGLLGNVMSDTELISVALLRGMMLGWLDVEYTISVVLASLASGTDKAFAEMAAYVKVFLVQVADALDSLPDVFNVTGDSMRTFANGMKTTIDVADAFDVVMGELNKSYDASRTKIIAETDAQADNIIAMKTSASVQSVLKTKVEETTAEVVKLESAEREAAKATKGYNDLLVQQWEELDKLELITVEATRTLYGLDDASQAIQQSLVEYQDSADKANAILERSVELYQEGKISLEDLNVITEKYAEVNEEVTSVVGELWERTTDSMYGHVEDFLFNGLEGFEDFKDSVEDVFKRLLASLASQWLTSGLTTLFASLAGNNGFDTSGFSFSNAFGDGGNPGGTADPISTILGIIKGGSGEGGGGDPVGSLVGGTAGTVSTISGALGGPTITSIATSIGGSIATALGLQVAASIPTATLGAAGIVQTAGFGAQAISSTIAANTAASFTTPTIAAAAGGGAGFGATLAAAAPYIAAALAVAALLSGNSRSYEEILTEDYLPDMFGAKPGSAIGADGGVGFAGGGNSAVLGANFGIEGTGITTQQLADGGENGNGGFFFGAQQNLDEFEEALRAAGIQSIENVNGSLRVLDRDKSVEDIKEVWQTYADGLDEAVTHNAVFQTAWQNDLIDPANLLFENMSVGFGQSAFEARESLLEIDKSFDSMRDNGMSATDNLFAAISEHYNIAIDDAERFVSKSGVATDKWVNNFTEASGANLEALLEFNEDGLTAFEEAMESASGLSVTHLDSIGEGFRELGEISIAEGLRIQQALISSVGSNASVGQGTTLSLTGINDLVNEVKRSNDLTSTVVRERRS
jgi:TP901 family phage tail tape measure protein